MQANEKEAVNEHDCEVVMCIIPDYTDYTFDYTAYTFDYTDYT